MSKTIWPDPHIINSYFYLHVKRLPELNQKINIQFLAFYFLHVIQ